jgi:hypothetical protein
MPAVYVGGCSHVTGSNPLLLGVAQGARFHVFVNCRQDSAVANVSQRTEGC